MFIDEDGVPSSTADLAAAKRKRLAALRTYDAKRIEQMAARCREGGAEAVRSEWAWLSAHLRECDAGRAAFEFEDPKTRNAFDDLVVDGDPLG